MVHGTAAWKFFIPKTCGCEASWFQYTDVQYDTEQADYWVFRGTSIYTETLWLARRACDGVVLYLHAINRKTTQ